MTTIKPTPSLISTTQLTKSADIHFNKSVPIILDKTTQSIQELEIKSFICPISLETLVEPVVDRCGHTYSKVSIENYCKLKSVDGKIFPCPLDPSTLINIDDMRKNYNLVDVMDETQLIIDQTKQSMEGRITALEQKFERQEKLMREDAIKIDILNAQRRVYKKQAKNLANMSFYDRINSVFFYSYLVTVQNRGLDRFELDYLKDRVILRKPY